MSDPVRRRIAFEGIALSVALEDARWGDALRDAEGIAREAVVASVRRVGLAPDLRTELGLTLTDDAAVRRLNGAWRGKDQPTNVLSFPIRDLEPGQAPGPMLGDLVLARETLLREATAERKSLADHFRHLVVHGTLHCLGFDHVEPGEAETMEALETAILADLGVADPYREFEPREEPARA